MERTRASRRLAAIIAADMVGYSRRMARDEEGTAALVRRLRTEVFDPVVENHGGRLVKFMGDGFLAEFASAVEAVRAALAIQDRLAAEAGDDPAAFRIGVNLGDIVIDGDDIIGDGVNIAARLESLAQPGASASRPRCMTKSATRSTSPSRTWASRR